MSLFKNSTLFLCLLGTAAAYADVPALDTAHTDLELGRADHALQLIDQTLAQQPQNAEAYNLRCRVFLQEKRWDDALTACQKAVKADGNNSDYHLWLARALGEKADRVIFITAFKMARQVKQEFETAARLDPKNVPALSDLGEFYVDAPAIVGGGLDKAEATAKQLDGIEPSRAYYLRARIAEANKDYAGAEKEFKAAIAASKEPGSSWMDLASFYRRRQQWDDMVQAVHSGAAADSTHGVAYSDGASLLTNANRDLPFARQLLEKYLASSHQSEDAPVFEVHARLGKLLTQMGDPQGAQQQFAEAQTLAKGFQVGPHTATNSGR